LNGNDIADARRSLLRAPGGFHAWCDEHHVRPALDALHPWAHWITPTSETRRFDTWFFLAAAPGGQDATVLVGEAVEGSWFPLETALDALDRGEVFLAPPTLRTIEELTSYTGLPAMLAASRARTLAPVHPRRLDAATEPTLTLPGDPDYGPGPAGGVCGPSRFVLRNGRWHSAS
jgi:hypothetical protein